MSYPGCRPGAFYANGPLGCREVPASAGKATGPPSLHFKVIWKIC